MKNTYKALKLSSIVLLITLFFVACDKEFNTIESDVLGKENSNFNTDNSNISIIAYNKKLDSVQINNLSSNFLGFFNDPAFGQTTASIVTQITPTSNSFNPDFGDNTVIDSVVLKIPYFSRIESTDAATGVTKYLMAEKDSLYGSAPIKLSIYQNNYFLRSFNPDPDINDPQNYYSKSDNVTDNTAITDNTIIDFNSNKGGLIYENLNFIPDASEIKTTVGEGTDAVTTRSAPALRVFLNNDFWKTAIIDKEGDAVLSNANNFNDYFRGLYFKAEAVGGDGHMVLLNLASTDANITIYYSKDSTVDGERTQSTYILNFTGNRLNPFINDYNLVTLANGDKNLGDEKLYLKGAAGSMAVIDLFSKEDLDGNGVSDQLDDLRKEYRDDDGKGDPIKLINQAQLVIYEDTPSLPGGTDYHKYDRIYAYDVNNNSPLIDYIDQLDPSENTNDPYNSKIIHLEQRKDIDDNGIFKYKIRITEHLNSLIFKDSTNTKIGLVLSSNVNITNSARILKSEDAVTAIPATAIITPRGTILHGSNDNVPVGQKMQLEVFFTEPSN